VVVVALFTAAPAWRAGRLKVLEAIRLGRTSVSARPSRIAAVAARLRLPVPVALGFKDAFAARSRALMTISSLSLTMFAVVAALGTEATYQRTINDSSLRAKPYDLLVGSDLSNARIEALLDRHRGEIARRATIAGFPVTADRGVPFQARALGGDYRARPYAVPDGRMIRGPGEAIVGRGLLERFKLKLGDRLRVHAMGAPVDLHIVGRYIEPDNDSVTAIFDEASLPAAQRARLRPDYALTIPEVSAARRLQAELQRESNGALRATITEDEVKQERDDLRPIVWGMDALLLGIGLVNLLTTLLLGIRERRRDFAIYKTVGLTPRQVLATVTSSGSLLAVVAVVIGIPFGSILFHSVVVATNPTDGPDLVTNPTWWWLLLLLPGMLVLTTIASLVPARQAAGVKPAEALRYE
jgi:putative ABC transport system permease protein